MADAEHEPPRPLVSKQTDLDLQERLLADRSKCLGAIRDDRAQARPQPSGQDHNRRVRQRFVRAHTASLR